MDSPPREEQEDVESLSPLDSLEEWPPVDAVEEPRPPDPLVEWSTQDYVKEWIRQNSLEERTPPDNLGEWTPHDEAPKETCISSGNQTATCSSTTEFTWRIKNVSRLYVDKLSSNIFELGKDKWRIVIFLGVNEFDSLSVYLEVADYDILPSGWCRRALFSLAIVNQVDCKHSIRKDTRKQFKAGVRNWGFKSFMPLSELYDPNRGYLYNDTILVEAQVAAGEAIDRILYASKKETGYVGLKNQGATCYMNSLLQTLYHIPYFREVVYRMPTTLNDEPSTSITMALQNLFYKLQYGEKSVSTKELTKSFGWDTNEAFLQCDVQEFNRALCEKLEEKMKRTVVEGEIRKIFEGHHMSIIECINVDLRSCRMESFYDLQLDVKGCHDVYDSFDKYVAVERLEGDNKYRAEQYGLQDAKKWVLFCDFPPVLQLHLKRFEYDFLRNIMAKINDYYEFPLQLDLDIGNGKYLSPEADRSVRNLYALHSVLVHRGDVHGGHYYAIIRPALSTRWYKFDDEHVTKENMRTALEELYGGEEELIIPGIINATFKPTRNSNAYMLVYVRESDMDKIMCSNDEKDIAEYLRERPKREQEKKEHQKKEKEDEHLYTIVKVACDDDFEEQIGRNLFLDLVDHDKVKSFRVLKSAPFSVFKEEVAKTSGVPVQLQRFWRWAKRKNGTYRPAQPLTHMEETKTIEQLMEVPREVKAAELKLFLEVELGLDNEPIPLPNKTEDDILLFFKVYDPETEDLRYAGKLYVNGIGTPADILTKLNEMAGYAPDEEIKLYKEIKIEPTVMCECINMKFTFKASQLVDGDIVCFQKSLSVETSELFDYPDVPTFLEYQHNLQEIQVHFRSLEKQEDEEFRLQLSRLDTYDEVVRRVARHLGVNDPAKIRLTSQDLHTQLPKPFPVEYHGVDNLIEMLLYDNQIAEILYYEILDKPLSELQGLRTLEITFCRAANNDMHINCLTPQKGSTVGDLLHDLRTKVELSHPNAELRLMKVFMHKIYKIFAADESIESLKNNYGTLRAEEICEEEKSLGPLDCMIRVYHFEAVETEKQMKIQNFGVPFFMVIHENEVLSHVKIRIQKKLNVPDDEFSKWRFAVVSDGRVEYLQDSEILFSSFQNSGSNISCERYLGLEHLSLVKTQASYIPELDLLAHQPKFKHYRRSYEKPMRLISKKI
ncbi:ubiquitin C-terminal hydrolase 13-like isoform X2 [Henckelia pumila]|uniref:ubiquitin C-terminal hydrolase 13-like isoform X2 n=1 Tax=Henckelia pumila TaxID=405737 RepID=UPI003C6E25E5